MWEEATTLAMPHLVDLDALGVDLVAPGMPPGTLWKWIRMLGVDLDWLAME